MSGSFLRNSSVQQLLRCRTISDISHDPATKMMAAFNSINRHQISHSRPYFRFSQFFRKSREYNEVFPYIFPSSSSAAAASSPSSGLAASFVGWYLGMIKSRPILTKSVTSSLIYVAADLSSQKLLLVEWKSSILNGHQWMVIAVAVEFTVVIWVFASFSRLLIMIMGMQADASVSDPLSRFITLLSFLLAPEYTILALWTIGRMDSEPYDFIRTLRMAGYGMLILGPSLHFWFNFVSKHFPKRDLITTFKKMIMGQTLYGPAMTVVFFSLNARLQGENSNEIVARLKRDLLPTLLNGVMYWPLCDFITFRFTPVHLQPLVSNSFSYLWTVYMTYMASKEKAGATN